MAIRLQFTRLVGRVAELGSLGGTGRLAVNGSKTSSQVRERVGEATVSCWRVVAVGGFIRSRATRSEGSRRAGFEPRVILSHMPNVPPNHARQQPRPSRRGGSPRVSGAGSLSSGV